jgi:anti-sigma B factor antagonist
MATPRTQLLVEEVAGDRTDTVVLRIHGELDISTADQLRSAVGPHLSGGGTVELDLSRVTFCDSTGLAVLVGFHKRLAASGGALVLYAPVQRVRHLLTITGLSRVFQVRLPDGEPGDAAGLPGAAPEDLLPEEALYPDVVPDPAGPAEQPPDPPAASG